MRTLTSQLHRSTLPGILFVLVSGFLMLDLLISTELEKDFDNMLETRAGALMALTEVEAQQIIVERYEQVFPQYSTATEPDYFALVSPDGRVVMASASLNDSDWLVTRNAQTTGRPKNIALPDGHRGRLVHRVFQAAAEHEYPVSSSSATILSLYLAVDRAPLDRLLVRLHWVLVGTGLLIMGLVVLLTHEGTRHAIAPLREIGAQMMALDHHRLNQKLRVKTDSFELYRLQHEFNLLLVKLHEAFERERRFSADVAHELRTPLAELKMLADVTVAWPDDPQLREHLPADFARAVERMQRLVTNLLTLAKNERSSEYSGQPIDLVAQIKSIMAPHHEVMIGKRLHADLQLPQHAFWVTHGELWQQILINLIDNAVSYARVDTTLTISLRPETTTNHNAINVDVPGGYSDSIGTTYWTLVFENASDNLEPQDLQRIFDRLWRKDSARSNENHSGLGLALVKMLVEQLNLQIHVELKEPALFSLSIPGIESLSPPLQGNVE